MSLAIAWAALLVGAALVAFLVATAWQAGRDD